MIARRPITRIPPPYAGKVPMDLLWFDIETLPSDDPVVHSLLTAKIKAPGSMKKPETIAQWEKEEKPILVEEAIAKTSFDGSYGSVCCISWAFGDLPAEVSIGPEARVLTDFFEAVLNYHLRGVPITTLSLGGHNIAHFDIRFLWKRAAILGIKRPVAIPWSVKPWDERIQDTMQLWDPEKRISLEALCYVLGVTHEEADFDGSMVAAAWKAGRFQQIARYCAADLESTRRCWFRMQ